MGKNKSGNKIGMILIIVLLVALLVLFAVGFAFLYKAMNKANEGGETNVVVEQQLAIEDITNFPLGDVIVTNLLEGPDKKEHVIKLTVSSLGINNSKDTSKEAGKLIPTLEAQKPIIKDTIIGICRSKTYEELNMTDARVVLKNEILVKLKEIFSTDLIVDVYIDEIFVQ